MRTLRVRKEDGMTQSDLYDWLLSVGVREPAVCMMGTRCVAGRWESIGEELPNGFMMRSGRLAVQVLGEGDTWTAAHEAAVIRLRATL